jgi:uncharacterized protein (TIGR00299 family) protein
MGRNYIRFDSVGGASGDMLLGALAAIGADLAAIDRTLRAFLPDDVRILCEPASDRGLQGLRASVRCGAAHHSPHWPDAEAPEQKPHGAHHSHSGPSRNLQEIAALLDASALDAPTRAEALAVFRRLAVAEGKIHGKPPETIHFHEIGATDSIADIVGCCLALRQLDVAGVLVGPLPCGIGVIHCAHGVMPNPAPATLELLAGLEVSQTDEPFELVTPTGAALLATWRETLQTPPAALRVIRTGFGFGHRKLNGRPNALRATLLSNSSDVSDRSAPSDLLVLETNLDDCNPQWIGEAIERMLTLGALDAWATPATMKKGRPAIVLSVLCRQDQSEAIREQLFRSTTTFGIRSYPVARDILDRRFEIVSTPYGEVRVKVGSRRGEDLVRSPEFEDCARLAREHNATPRQVYEAAARTIRTK